MVVESPPSKQINRLDELIKKCPGAPNGKNKRLRPRGRAEPIRLFQDEPTPEGEKEIAKNLQQVSR